MTSARADEVRTRIDAPPEKVWDVLADLDRMGEWSPECYRVRWLDGATSPAKPSARFKGANRSGPLRWSMTCEVKVAERGRELAWSTVRGDKEIVRWSYRMEADAHGGCEVVESFRVLSWPRDVWFFEDVVMRNRDERRRAAMRTTLERIKVVVERAS